MDEDIDWPDNLKCGACGAVVRDGEGVKINVAHLVIPREPDLYAWCEEHAPDSKEEEDELWRKVKRGELLEQAQSWEDY
ncbi:hypothetical protein DJ71_24740 [Halorubrum sp. E3]|nr:hypothetical protein DJ71_24740 [Halorubrum sp. E3]